MPAERKGAGTAWDGECWACDLFPFCASRQASALAASFARAQSRTEPLLPE